MKEEFRDSHTIKNTSTQDEGQKIMYGIPENEIIEVAKEVSKNKSTPVGKEVLVAIIKDINLHRAQGKSFSEARRTSMQRWTGNYGEEYWKSISSAIGTLYSRKGKNKLEISEKKEDIPGNGYKDFY